MACELLQREIPTADGRVVLVGVRQLAASKALDLHVELVRTTGTSIFPFIENKYNFADIIRLMQVSNDALVELMRRVVSMATLDGNPVTPALIDIKFSNDLMLLHKVFAFVVEVNFHDFFKEGLEINAQRLLEAEEASKLAEQKNSSPDQI